MPPSLSIYTHTSHNPNYITLSAYFDTFQVPSTSNGDYCREVKSCKHWLDFSKLLSSVTAHLLVRINLKQLYGLIALKKIGLSKMS